MIHVAVTWYGLKYIATQDYAWYVNAFTSVYIAQRLPPAFMDFTLNSAVLFACSTGI